ncbi:Pentatricopeptide repeat-containing protein, chloroplastic [Symbiodinium microadriaticum]|uniref:Pentatricopeptide repeat-containing protein, chloroplastic n=1 Tax=Symbiodinium microadriaticum TaxID=2951 RepID=A0A1Q9F074_SYMMI|nr:Pentatricopeptide repeat-containing protein, chloroplastic [Symbiodinium microadriaticum]
MAAFRFAQDTPPKAFKTDRSLLEVCVPEVMVEADLITYSALANAVEAKGYWRWVTFARQSLARLELRTGETFMNVKKYITAPCQTAVDINFQLRERGLQADVVLGNTVISATEKGNQWTVAISLLDQMSLSHLKRTEITVNSVISACEKGLQWKQAESLLFIRPPGYGSGQLHIAADTFAYNSVMSAYEECSLWMHGLSALSLMSSKHVRADVVTFTSSIGACEWEHCYELLHVMPGHRVLPNVVAMSSAISSAEKGDQWELALCTLALMLKLKVSPNDVSFNSAIIACARGGKWELALHLLEKMMDLHLAPDLFTGTSTVWALETTGEWQQALDFLECMPQTRAKPNVFGCASDVNICERQGDWQKGSRLINILSQVAMLRI